VPILHFTPAPGPSGTPPSAPSSATVVTKDAGATVSFLAPASPGSGSITSYTVTPYIAGVAQAPATTAVGSAGSITGSNGSTYVQCPATGLTNGTAYTFTVHASSSAGAGPESAATGAGTPRAGLVYGDDFNGTLVDPEWYVYNRCGYIAQSEVEWYLPSQVTLDGSGNMLLTASTPGHTGPSYPSDGNTTRAQPWLSGACQSNTRSYAPSADGNTMTFETRFQICPGIAGGMWPGLLWLEGTFYQAAWKTDPFQSGWDLTGKAELDIAEFGSSGQTSPAQSVTSFLSNLSTGSGFTPESGVAPGGAVDYSAAQHVFSATWKGTSVAANRAVKWYVDAPYVSGTGPSGGTLVTSVPSINNAQIPVQSSCAFFLNLYLQIRSTGASSPQACTIDYVRIYDELI
jgi:hypothetical protein